MEFFGTYKHFVVVHAIYLSRSSKSNESQNVRKTSTFRKNEDEHSKARIKIGVASFAIFEGCCRQNKPGESLLEKKYETTIIALIFDHSWLILVIKET